MDLHAEATIKEEKDSDGYDCELDMNTQHTTRFGANVMEGFGDRDPAVFHGTAVDSFVSAFYLTTPLHLTGR